MTQRVKAFGEEAWKRGCGPENPGEDGSIEETPQSCPLTSTHMPWCAHAPHTDNKYNLKLNL